MALPITRRSSSWLATFVALGALLPSAAGAAEPIRTLDLRAHFDVAAPDVATRRAAYDDLVAATCLQGLVNRNAPRLYLFYVKSVVDGSIDTDQLWFDRMKDPAIGGPVVSGRTIEPMATLEAAIDAYASYVKGLVVWDEKVPATVNAAFAAAAAEDLIAVRWDASPTSLHQRLLKKGFVAKVSLVNADGSSRFLDKQGSADVPDVKRMTSQSAKADAYVWALEKYLKTKQLDGRELGWMLDARWLLDPRDYSGGNQATNQLQITNHDFLVARKGMAFDLSPWSDVAATDDPGQPVGTDVAILDEIMAAARAGAGDDAITVRGFFAWQFKYTTLQGLPAGHEPVMGEWTSVKRISKQAAGLDADAPGIATMANASFFQHVPLDEVPEPQTRPTPEDLIGRGFLQGLAPNGGFEDGESSWTMHVTNHVPYEDPRTGASRSHSGLRYLECNTSAVGDDLQDNLYRDGPAASVGQRVTLRAFVRAPASKVDGELAIWGLGGKNEQAGVKFTAGADWTEVRATLDVKEAGHTSTRGQIYLRTGGGANLDVDDVAFYAGDAAAAPVEPATYALWFVGDYDAAAWVYEVTPITWDGPGRGLVPFAWDFSAHVAARFPPFFRHALRTRTPRDFFVGADSGPGYGNPSQMDAPARAIWAKAGMHDARVLDTSMGWVLDPLATLDATHLGAVTPFLGDGALLYGSGPAIENQNVEHAPVVKLDNFGGTDVASGTTWTLGAVPAAPTAPAFHAFRAVLWKSTDLVAITHDVSVGHADRKVRFVDPYSFSALSRLSFGERTTHRASYRAVAIGPAITGEKVHVTLTVHNDGFETWRATGANAHRVGFDVRDTAPGPRALPPAPGSYPTRISLAADVPPGAEATIAADLPASTAVGHRVLQVDVVEEGITWFESAGDIPLQVGLDVIAPSSDAGATDGAASDATTSDGAPPRDDASGDAGASDAATGDGEGTGDGCGCRTGHDAPTGRTSFVLVLLALGGWRRFERLRSRADIPSRSTRSYSPRRRRGPRSAA